MSSKPGVESAGILTGLLGIAMVGLLALTVRLFNRK